MLTKDKYDAIVFMLKGGATDDVIMKSQGINQNTLHKVKSSNGNFDRYRELHGEMLKHVGRGKCINKQSTVVEHHQTVTVQATHYMETELRTQTELLKTISNKLAYILETLDLIKEAWK